MTCLFTLEGMQSECVQCIQNAFLPNTKTKIQDLRRSLVENLGNTKIQDLHRSLEENLGNTKIQDPRFPQDSWLKSKILARSLVGILDLGSWYFQDFPQDFCANLGSWSWYWAGMHSLAFSGSDKIALSTF